MRRVSFSSSSSFSILFVSFCCTAFHCLQSPLASKCLRNEFVFRLCLLSADFVLFILFGTDMRPALLTLIFVLAQATLAADGVTNLRELLSNTNRSGFVLLDQGY